MVNVAVWHKTDQKDELHPVCWVRFTVADVGRPSFFFSFLFFFFFLFAGCVCLSASFPQKQCEVCEVMCCRVTRFALTVSF